MAHLTRATSGRAAAPRRAAAVWALAAGIASAASAMSTNVAKVLGNVELQVGGCVQGGNGLARETVYVPLTTGGRYRLSELDWQIRGVVMAGLRAAAQWSGGQAVALTCLTALNEGTGEMQDYDWLEPGMDWTDWSRSDAVVEAGRVLDAEASLPLFPLAGSLQWKGLLGYRYLYWKWSDRGREYIYSSYGFRDTEGNFGGARLVEYEQWYSIPYAGTRLETTVDQFRLSASVLVSPIVQAGDLDHHLQRKQWFSESFSGGDYLAVSASAAYALRPCLEVGAAVEMQTIPEFAGDMRLVSEQTVFPDAAGISYQEVAGRLSLTRAF
jgi:plasminogen activator